NFNGYAIDKSNTIDIAKYILHKNTDNMLELYIRDKISPSVILKIQNEKYILQIEEPYPFKKSLIKFKVVHLCFKNDNNYVIFFPHTKSINNEQLYIYIKNDKKVSALFGNTEIDLISVSYHFCFNRWISGIPLAFMTTDNKILLIEKHDDENLLYNSPW